MLSRHYWPVFNPGDVSHPKGVPDDTVSLYQIPVLQQEKGNNLFRVPM